MPPTDDRNLVDAFALVTARIKGDAPAGIIVPQPLNRENGLTFLTTKEGRLRWTAIVSNNFRDRDKEIIPESVHQEYIEWATKSNRYPQLWLWHAGPLSKWGQTDWVDMTDGFVVATGLVDAGKEHIAHQLQTEPLAVSHGFVCTKDTEGVVTKYRTFELSPLPAHAPSNIWTGFKISLNQVEGNKEAGMAFSPEKREWLMKMTGMTDAQVKATESAAEELAHSLKSRGIEWKDFDITAPANGATANASLPVQAGNGVSAVEKARDPMLPHANFDTHSHTHIDGTVHEHAHHHGDGVVGHDSPMHHISHVAHMSMTQSGVTKEVKSEAPVVPEVKVVEAESTATKEAPVADPITLLQQELLDLKASVALWQSDKAAKPKKDAADNDADDESTESDAEKADEAKAMAKKKEIADAQTKEIADLRAIVQKLQGELTGVKEQTAKSHDDIGADFFRSRVMPNVVPFRASESAGNVKEHLKASDIPGQTDDEANWFGKVVLKGIATPSN